MKALHAVHLILGSHVRFFIENKLAVVYMGGNRTVFHEYKSVNTAVSKMRQGQFLLDCTDDPIRVTHREARSTVCAAVTLEPMTFNQARCLAINIDDANGFSFRPDEVLELHKLQDAATLKNAHRQWLYAAAINPEWVKSLEDDLPAAQQRAAEQEVAAAARYQKRLAEISA